MHPDIPGINPEEVQQAQNLDLVFLLYPWQTLDHP